MKSFIYNLVLLLIFLPLVTRADSLPAFPMAFWGTVALNGNSAPVGTVVRAYYGSVLAGTATVQESGIYGYTEPTKQKLVVGEGAGQLNFTVQSTSFGDGSETTGNSVASHSGFVSGSTIQKNLEFTLPSNQIVPNTSGAVTVTSNTPKVVIVNQTQAVTVTINSGTSNPTIDVSSFITGGTGTLPKINITSANANNAEVAISASTVVTSADTTWNGIIAAPTVTTVTLPEISGQTKTLSTAIEVGFTGAKLSFDKAVRLLLPGQAGKKVGYIRTGITFTEITNTCATDNQTTGDALATDGDCKIDVGSDLVIWTKHFTSFATYTQTTNSSNDSGGSGSSGGSGDSGGGGGGSYSSTPLLTTSPLSTTAQKVDTNKDNKIDVLDFVILMANWGKTGSSVTADFNSDGKVDILDFVMLMANWTK